MTPVYHVTPGDDLQALFDTLQPGALVRFSPGVYRQKLILRTPEVTLVGSGAAETVIVFDDHAKKPHPIGWEYNTFRTYTLAVCADGVTVRDMTIENDAGNPKEKGQEVALSVVGTDFLMENCCLRSTQDTLFAGPLPHDLIGRYEGFLDDSLRRGIRMRQTFRNCRIEGTVDFIFGCAEALFENCEIRSVKEERSVGFVAAPAHGPELPSGFRFLNCRFTCDPGVAPGSIYLARPWRDYGMAAFESCSYGPHIAEAGFDKWNDTSRDRTARFYESPAAPGRVAWINRR